MENDFCTKFSSFMVYLGLMFTITLKHELIHTEQFNFWTFFMILSSLL